MGLVNCPDCGKQVSDEAVTCIGCGKPMKKSRERIVAEIQIKLDERRGVQRQHDELEAYWESHPGRDYNRNLRDFQDRIGELDQKIKELKCKL